jgi:uncharacterized protein (DUF2336 family)
LANGSFTKPNYFACQQGRLALGRLGRPMSVTASLIPELESIVHHGSQAKRAKMLQRIADLFIEGAKHFSDEHVALFDDVFCRLVVEIEAKVRAEVSRDLAPISNAPTQLMRTFAYDDDIAIAGPVLRQSSRLQEHDLVELAKTKGQDHLAVIAGRQNIGEPVTDVLVHRGNTIVVHNVADNRSARLSEGGFSALIQRADSDGDLAEKVGQRPDMPPQLFRDLLVRATAVVQQRLLAAAKPETQAEIQRALEKVSKELNEKAPVRDYTVAQRAVLELYQMGRLSEAKLVDFANARKFEETVAALSVLCGVPIETTDRLLNGDRPDPILILCKAAGYGWPTARAIMVARPAAKRPSSQLLDAAFVNFEKLSSSTAQRVVRFWQVRQAEAS